MIDFDTGSGPHPDRVWIGWTTHAWQSAELRRTGNDTPGSNSGRCRSYEPKHGHRQIARGNSTRRDGTYQELTHHPEIPRSDPKNAQRFAMLAYQTALGDLASRRDFSVGIVISRLLQEG